MKKGGAPGGAGHVAACTTGGHPNRVLDFQDSSDQSETKVFRVHAPPQGARENLVCALKLLEILHAGGDNLVDMIFEGLREHE